MSTSDPVIEAANTEIKATESDAPESVIVDVIGKNLAGSTLTATLSPAVEGLSVNLDNTKITNGEISAKATITYMATENAKGTTTLVLSDGTTTKEVAVNYQAAITLQTISEATTWDFSKGISGGVQFTTAEDKAKENIYINIEGLTFTDAFNAGALAFKGEYPLRSGKTYAQNGTLHFKTSVQGTITVKFSDTGSGATSTAKPRYLVVNGEQTEYWTSRPNDGKGELPELAAKLDVTSGAIFVPAGDVTITGSEAITVSIITFTPVTGTDVKIENGKGYRTFASKYPTDWSEVTGVTAYTAKINGDEVRFTEVSGLVPAGEGLLLKGEDGTYTIPTATTVPAEIDNAFVGVTSAKEVEGSIFILYADDAHKIGFYKTTAESFTVGANTAYIPANVVSEARTFISLDGETTGIDAAIVNNDKQTNDVYNLNGQRVAQPTKGLYIVNGKKVIIK